MTVAGNTASIGAEAPRGIEDFPRDIQLQAMLGIVGQELICISGTMRGMRRAGGHAIECEAEKSAIAETREQLVRLQRVLSLFEVDEVRQ